jgi:26S proteasome regulatory subunit N1
LKDNINNWVEEILTGNEEAFDKLDNEVRSATSTMTSIPKPFKFLVGLYEPLEEYYGEFSGSWKVRI